ncbi:phosphate ABC transporter substrate-binding protein PstS [Desulfosarcina cetonica]
MIRRIFIGYLVGIWGLVGVWIWTALADAQEILSGAGATFPRPFYQRLIEVYKKRTGVRIDYRGVGSGAGIRLLLEKKVDFGASDIYLSDGELAKLPSPLLHIPTCIGAVAIITHLPGNPTLNLDPALLADIFMGRITRWSAKPIRAINSGVIPAKLTIRVVHRADSSGTNYILTDYLSKTSPVWRTSVGRGKRVNWPVGMGTSGNAGVAAMVARIPGSIGYVSLNYAEAQGLAVAAIRNQSGRYIKPTPQTVSQAAQIPLPDDARMLISDTAVPDGYPISAFTYILVYQEQAYGQRTHAKSDMLVDFLRFIVHDGQPFAAELSYAPLPDEAIQCAERTIRSIIYTAPP